MGTDYNAMSAQIFANGINNGMGYLIQSRLKQQDADAQLAQMVKEQAARKGLQDQFLAARAKELADDNARRALEKEANVQEAVSDPRNVLARRKAQAELDAMGQPNPDADLAAKVNRAKLEKELNTLVTPQPPTIPTARVRQNFGDAGYIDQEIPVTDLEKSIGTLKAAGYKDPYAEQIAALEGDVGKQQAALAGGSAKAGGFLGIGGTPRADIAASKQREILQLRAAQLKDQVARGIITPEEADRRAEALMGR